MHTAHATEHQFACTHRDYVSLYSTVPYTSAEGAAQIRCVASADTSAVQHGGVHMQNAFCISSGMLLQQAQDDEELPEELLLAIMISAPICSGKVLYHTV